MCDRLCCQHNRPASVCLTMEAKVDGYVDDIVITDNTVKIEAGEGKSRLWINGMEISGMVRDGWTFTHEPGDVEASVTVTFPVRVPA